LKTEKIYNNPCSACGSASSAFNNKMERRWNGFC